MEGWNKKGIESEKTLGHRQWSADCWGSEGVEGGGGGCGVITSDGQRLLGVVNTQYSVQMMCCGVVSP